MFKSLKIFLYNKDIQLIITAVVVGGALKIICKDYIKNNPELFEETKNSKSKSINNKKESIEIRGGAFITFSGISFTIQKLVIEFVAENGITTFVSLAIGKILESKGLVTVFTRKLPNALKNHSVQNLAENNNFRLVDSEKVYFELCNSSLQFLVDILEDLVIPYSKKQEKSDNILLRGISDEDLGSFSLCLVDVLEILYKNKNSKSEFFILLESLTKSIEEGRIPKKVGRIIRRKLKRARVSLSPEFLDAVATSSLRAVMDVPRGGSSISIKTIREKKIDRIWQKIANKKMGSLLSRYGSLAISGFVLYKMFSSTAALNVYVKQKFDSIPSIERHAYTERSREFIFEPTFETAESTEGQVQVGDEKVETKKFGEQNKKSPDQEKSSNLKPIQNIRKPRKRSKMVTLSDLPPVSNDDFDEVCEEMYETYGHLLGEKPIKVN